MKHSLCVLLGVLLVSGAVVGAGGRPAGMFAAGMASMSVFSLCGISTLGMKRIGGFLLALDSALRSDTPQRAATPDRRKTPNLTIRKNRNVLSFQKPHKTMLSTTQQQVVSALNNLGMGMTEAERSVLEASQGKPGIDFETLFRACMPARKAATN